MYCIKANCVREYESLLTDQREALTEFNTKRLTIMYFNGDVCDRWKTQELSSKGQYCQKINAVDFPSSGFIAG